MRKILSILLVILIIRLIYIHSHGPRWVTGVDKNEKRCVIITSARLVTAETVITRYLRRALGARSYLKVFQIWQALINDHYFCAIVYSRNIVIIMVDKYCSACRGEKAHRMIYIDYIDYLLKKRQIIGPLGLQPVST